MSRDTVYSIGRLVVREWGVGNHVDYLLCISDGCRFRVLKEFEDRGQAVHMANVLHNQLSGAGCRCKSVH